MIKKLTHTTSVVSFIVFILFVKTTCFDIFRIPSTSMEPAIQEKSFVGVNKLSYGLWLPFVHKPVVFWSEPKRGDVILFTLPHEDAVSLKRVVGLPGDEIRFNEGIVFRNGTKENGICTNTQKLEKTFFETRRFQVPNDKYFVLGDNCDASVDSRDFAYVRKSDIYGKLIF